MKNTPRFETAMAQFDALNSEDPNQTVEDGLPHPKELLYAERMTKRLAAFAPDASEALQLAARCQHIQRWKIPRSEYPKDRIGYKRWRNALMQFHAQTAGSVLQETGYDEDTINRVQHLVKKKGLKSDAETQTLEDVICLVFLEHYALDFAQQHTAEKVLKILQKTWIKMSSAGQQAAFELALPDAVRDLLEQL